MTAVVYVDGVAALGLLNQQAGAWDEAKACNSTSIIYVKKGSTITTRENYGTYNLRVYKLK